MDSTEYAATFRAFMRAVLLSLALFSLATPAWADRFAMTYAGAGLGFVPLGELTVDADVAPDSYNVRAHLVSGGLLNLFERTNLTAESSGEIRNGVVRWRSYNLDHHYSKKHRTVTMQAADDGAISATIVPNYRLWGEPPASDEQRRRSRDPISTMVAMAIDVGQTRRCAGSYPTFDGRFYYLLELSGGDIDRFNSGGYDGDVLKCDMAYVAVAGFEPRDAGRRRVPQGSVWFALVPDSTYAPVVRIGTPLSAGGAVIRLTSFHRAHVAVDAEQPAAQNTLTTP